MEQEEVRQAVALLEGIKADIKAMEFGGLLPKEDTPFLTSENISQIYGTFSSIVLKNLIEGSDQ